MKSRFTIDEFLELKNEVGTELHYRDACGGSVIELSDTSDEIVEKIKAFFDKKNIAIEFSAGNKYIFTK